MPTLAGERTRASSLERLAANVVRSVHIAAVAGAGAWVLGAPVNGRWALGTLVASGTLLLAMDLMAARLHLGEAAGAAVILKLLLAALALWQPGWAVAIFFAVVLLSSLTAHAPKAWRHRRVVPKRIADAGR